VIEVFRGRKFLRKKYLAITASAVVLMAAAAVLTGPASTKTF
jgi:hypothetical protein